MAQAAPEPAPCLVTWTPPPRNSSAQLCGRCSWVLSTQEPTLRALNSKHAAQNLISTTSSDVLVLRRHICTNGAILLRRTETRKKYSYDSPEVDNFSCILDKIFWSFKISI